MKRLKFQSRWLSLLVLPTFVFAGCGGSADDGNAPSKDRTTHESGDETGDGGISDGSKNDPDSTDDLEGKPAPDEKGEIGEDTGPAATEEDVEGLLNDTIDSLVATADKIEAADSNGMTSDSMTSVVQGFSGCGTVDPLQLDVGPLVQALSDGLAEVSDALKENVFRDDLVESDDGTTVVYWLDPDKVCDEDDDDCVSALTETEVRVSVTDQDDDTLLVELLVDDRNDHPMSMVLSDSGMEVTVDLEKTLDVLRDFAGEGVTLPESLSGVLRASLVKNSEDNFTLSYGLLEPLTFSVPYGDSGDAIVGSYAASEDAVSATFDGDEGTIAYAIDWKNIDVTIPGSVVCGETEDCGDKEREGSFNVHVGGLSYGTVLQDGLTEIVIDDVGLGNDTTAVRLNDESLVEIDLNPQDGRRLTIQIQDTEAGTLVTFEPKFDLRIATTLSNLSESLRADLPGWLEDEIFRVTFGGDARAQMLIPDDCNDGGQSPEIVEGTLTLEATSSSGPVVVEAGMCVVQAEAAEDETLSHPFDMIAAGTCE